MHLIGIIEVHKEPLLIEREVGEHFGRSAVTWWCHGNDDMVERREQKGDFLYNMVVLRERETVKATDQLHKLIISLDVPFIPHINTRDLETLGPQFLRLL